MASGKKLVLLGAGHAHLHVLRRAATIARRGHLVSVVAPRQFWYSGLASGMLGGQYEAAADQVDVAALARSSGAVLIDDHVVALDRGSRHVRLQDGCIDYDVLSISLGSEVAALPGDGELVFGAKPIERLWALRHHLETTGSASRIVVAGGGLTACELALNLAGLLRRLKRPASITLVTPVGGLLRRVSPTSAARLRRALRERGVATREDGPVLSADARRARLPTGDLAFDVLVNATGLVPPASLRAFGLPLDAAGALRVDARLRSIADPTIHGAGDCIAFDGATLPKAGVFAVRQGPVLAHNLLASLEGRSAKPFRPQKRYLWIINRGDGTGLATYGGWHLEGRSALWMKDRIDKRFLRSLRRQGLGS